MRMRPRRPPINPDAVARIEIDGKGATVYLADGGEPLRLSCDEAIEFLGLWSGVERQELHPKSAAFPIQL